MLQISIYKRLDRDKLFNKDTIDNVDDVTKFEKKWLVISGIVALVIAGFLGYYNATNLMETIMIVGIAQFIMMSLPDFFGFFGTVVKIMKDWAIHQRNGDEGNR